MTDQTITAVLSAKPSASSAAHQGSPAPLLIEAIDGPMDGMRAVFDGPQITLGRNQDNDLSLHGDSLVSSNHARLSRTDAPDVVLLEDLRSANGTWLQGAPLIAPHAVSPGSSFLVGQTVLRCQPLDARQSYCPPSEELDGERLRLIDLLSPELRQSYGAATMLACKEQRNYVNDRHFFLGLAMSCPDLPPFQRGRGAIHVSLLSQILGANSQWTGTEAWLEDPLREILSHTTFFSVYLPLVPRLVALLHRAQGLARERNRAEIQPNDCLRAMFGDTEERPYATLQRLGLDPQALLRGLGGGVVPPIPAPRTDTSTGAMRALSVDDGGTDTSLRLTTASSGDPTIDDQAQELARRLNGLAALYHLATPEDRRSAMQHLLRQEMAEWPDHRQRQLLMQLRSFFPLDPGSSQDAAEVENLWRQIEQLKHRVAELEATSQGPSTSGLPWHLIVEASHESSLGNLSPVELPRIEFLRQMLSFSVEVERFVVGLVQSFTANTSSTTTFALPGHRMSIRAFIDDMAAGRQVNIDVLARYLADIESWLVAGFAAYHEAPEIWFKKYWEKASPIAIESRLREGWAKKLGLQYAELWKDYKDLVRKVTPEFVTQNIQHEARKIAHERQEQFSNGRT